MFEIVKHLVRRHAENRKDAFLEGTCEEGRVYVYNGYPLCDVEGSLQEVWQQTLILGRMEKIDCNDKAFHI